ncbi:2-oxoacid:acceptor oxidoreductase subunit alpha [Candidatus Acetothermia bacterium]|nr:2-oxoacid:acceptor oxidoreductase subunit alpha [Candidatus Acetothermia bacterium]
MTRQRLVQGNEACAYGALYAGCRFYAGYPITPSSEIMEIMARELPQRGGIFIQMEDEIASISALIGAAWAGAKAMTATSGPGFSLMQEGIGYASITETSCVIVDAQRWGPSTGQPTKTAQADVMQAIWGTHGDHPIVVLTASHVRDVFEMTVRAFNISEQYRVPVILLLDEVLSHMRENVALPEPGELTIVERQRPAQTKDFTPFGHREFLAFGEGVRFNVTGMAHNERGFPVQGEEAEKQLLRIVNKIQTNVEKLALYESTYLEDARVLIASFGITSRAAESAVDALRKDSIPAGLLDLKTLWPFPDFLFKKLAAQMDYILVPELNLGQIAREVERAVQGRSAVDHLGRADGSLITPQQIYDRVKRQLGTLQKREVGAYGIVQ